MWLHWLHGYIDSILCHFSSLIDQMGMGAIIRIHKKCM
jgi:hypothetical protein